MCDVEGLLVRANVDFALVADNKDFDKVLCEGEWGRDVCCYFRMGVMFLSEMVKLLIYCAGNKQSKLF